MSLTVKNLAQGTIHSVLNTSPSILYPTTAPSTPVGALIRSIALSNISGATAKVQLKIRPGNVAANDRYIAPVELTLPVDGQAMIEASFTLTAGAPTLAEQDQIIAWLASGQPDGVAYVISGIERDQ